MKEIKWLGFITLCSVLTLSACSLEMEDEDVALGKYTAPISDATPGSKPVDIGDSTFDDGSLGMWGANDSASLTSEQNIVHAGNYSLKVAARTAPEDGATMTLGEQLVVNNNYTISAWVRLASGEAPVSDITKLVLHFADDNGENSVIVAEATASDSKWVKLSGKFLYEPAGTVSMLPTFSIQGPAASQDFYVDTVTVTDHGADSDEIAPLEISVASGWRVSAGELVYTTDGASYQPTSDGQQLVFDMIGPVDLSTAEIVFTYKVDQTYIDSGSEIQPFAQAKQGSWTGHWGCYIGNGDLPAADNEEGSYTCALDSADFNLLDETMGIQIGFQSKGSAISGTLTVTGVSIILPAPVSNDIAAETASGWRVSEGLAVDYSADGVSYQPTIEDHQLLYDISGPVDFSSADVMLVYTVDQALIDSMTDIQVVAQAKQGSWTGEWGCTISNGDLPAANEDSTYTCSIAHEDFNLVDDTMGMQFGVQVKGGAITGQVTIKSMDIILPD